MLLEGDTDIDLDGGLMAKSDGKAGLRFLDITHKLYFRSQATLRCRGDQRSKRFKQPRGVTGPGHIGTAIIDSKMDDVHSFSLLVR